MLNREDKKRPRSGKCANFVMKEKSPCLPWTESCIGCARRMRSSKRLSEAEAEMDIRNWEQRIADLALYAKKSRTRISEIGDESMDRSGSKRKDYLQILK